MMPAADRDGQLVAQHEFSATVPDAFRLRQNRFAPQIPLDVLRKGVGR